MLQELDVALYESLLENEHEQLRFTTYLVTMQQLKKVRRFRPPFFASVHLLCFRLARVIVK